MALWKQIIVALVLAAGALAGWVALAPGSAPGVAVEAARAIGLVAAPEAPAQAGPRRGPGGFGGGPTRVVVATARDAQDASRLSAIGTAEAARSVTLNAPDDGIVAEVLFAPGASVEAGAPLLVLDDRAERIALRRAEIAVRSASDQVARVERLRTSQAASIVQAEDARAGLEQAQADAAAAELALERRTLRAPFSGRLGLAQVEVGQRVTTQTPVVALDDRARVLVRFAVPERFAGRVAPGDAVEAQTAAFPGETFGGVVEEIDSRVDPASRALAVRAGFDNADDRLRPGMSFSATLRFPGEARVAVPAQAVQWDRQGSYVWRVDGDVVARVAVTLGARADGEALVSGPLRAGDVVVLEGLQRLREGAPVAVATDAAPPAAAPDRRS